MDVTHTWQGCKIQPNKEVFTWVFFPSSLSDLPVLDLHFVFEYCD